MENIVLKTYILINSIWSVFPAYLVKNELHIFHQRQRS